MDSALVLCSVIVDFLTICNILLEMRIYEYSAPFKVRDDGGWVTRQKNGGKRLEYNLFHVNIFPQWQVRYSWLAANGPRQQEMGHGPRPVVGPRFKIRLRCQELGPTESAV